MSLTKHCFASIATVQAPTRSPIKLEAKEPYGHVRYADPGYQADGKKRYPIDNESHIRAAWSYISKDKNASAYSPANLRTIKRRIIAAWKKHIDVNGPPSTHTLYVQFQFEAQLDDNQESLPAFRNGMIRGKPIELTPIGVTFAVDGRIVLFSDSDADDMLLDLQRRDNDLPIDVMHRKDITIGSRAVGWMNNIVKKDGSLWALDVYWTPEGAEMLRTKKFRYVSMEARGPGMTYKGRDVLRPKILFGATICTSPAIPGMQEIELSTIGDSNSLLDEGASTRKETVMNHAARCAALGLDTSSTSEADSKKQHKEALVKLGVSDAQYDTMYKDPDEDDEDEETDDDAAKIGVGAHQMGAGSKTPKIKAMEIEGLGELITLSIQRAVKEGSTFDAAKTLETATKSAIEATRNELNKQKLTSDVKVFLDTMETEGRIEPAERTGYETELMKNFQFTSGVLAKLPKRTPAGEGGIFREGADIRPGSYDPSISIDQKNPKEQTDILSRASAWHMHTGIPYKMAFSAVMDKNAQEMQFQAEIRATREYGKKWEGRMRPGLRETEIDPGLVKSIGDTLKKNKIDPSVIPLEVQQFATDRVHQLATIGSVQQPTRSSLNVGIAFLQGERIGSELLPEYVGGVDRRCSYPKMSTEIYEMVVGADGYPVPVGLNATDVEESDFDVDFPIVDIKTYANKKWADRILQEASVSLPMGIMAHLAELAINREKDKKEFAQALKLTSTASWDSAARKTYSSSGVRWSSSTGTPVTDITAAMMAVWNATGQWPDIIGMGPNTLMSLRRSQQLINIVYVGSANKGTIVPMEALMAVFGISFLVGTTRNTTKVGGASPTANWGNDAVMVVSGRGEVLAPRLGFTVVSAGYPKQRALVKEDRGADGSDGVQCSDAYSLEIALNNAGFLFKTVTDTLAP